ncbi:MAG: hypothetical protein FWD34_02560 [Oscillospiraceae bacterium]|nr:hypothetical protein [Oscillospiraceae bacterium]
MKKLIIISVIIFVALATVIITVPALKEDDNVSLVYSSYSDNTNGMTCDIIVHKDKTMEIFLESNFSFKFENLNEFEDFKKIEIYEKVLLSDKDYERIIKIADNIRVKKLNKNSVYLGSTHTTISHKNKIFEIAEGHNNTVKTDELLEILRAVSPIEIHLNDCLEYVDFEREH